jgi:sarcosine oxidase, subunit alpha
VDKLRRLGVPLYTSHTVLAAHGAEELHAVTIARVDQALRPVTGTQRTLGCDTILIAVGLDPVDEFTHKARAAGLPVFAAGDAQAIAEASAAIYTGRIAGREAALTLGKALSVPGGWHRAAEVLKSHPGPVKQSPAMRTDAAVFPVLHCNQEIPCNPCTTVCPQGLIQIAGDNLRGIPVFIGTSHGKACVGCERCVTTCPGLAITLVDRRDPDADPTVSLPYELPSDDVAVGTPVRLLDTVGEPLCETTIVALHLRHHQDRTAIVKFRAAPELAGRVAGFRVVKPVDEPPILEMDVPLSDDAIVCRCERVTAGEIRALIEGGVRDVNEIKAVTRAGMGACGGRTCNRLILHLFREAGIDPETVTEGTRRPLFVEVALAIFAGAEETP